MLRDRTKCRPLALGSTTENYFAMLFDMSRCIVSFIDLEDFGHSVTVEAASLYEAAAVGIRKFRDHGLNPTGPTKIHVEVISSVVHELTVLKLEDWLSRPGRVPKEITEKDRLRQLLSHR